MQNIQKTQLLFFFTFTFLSSQLFAQVKPARIYCENSVFENYILYTLRSDVITDYTPQFFKFVNQSGQELINVNNVSVVHSNPLEAQIYFTASNNQAGQSLYSAKVDYTLNLATADEVSRLPFLPPEGDDESSKYGLRNHQHAVGKYNGMTSIIYPKYKDTRNGNTQRPIYDYLYNPIFNSNHQWIAFNWYDLKSKLVKGGITTPLNEKTIYLPTSRFHQNKLHFISNNQVVWFESGQPLTIHTANITDLEKSKSNQIAQLPSLRSAKTLIGFADKSERQWIAYTDETQSSPVLQIAELKKDQTLSEFKSVSYPNELIDLVPSNRSLGLLVLNDVQYHANNEELIFALGLNGAVAIFNLKAQQWRILGQLNSFFHCLKVSIGEESE